VSAIKRAGGIVMRTHRGSNPDWVEYAEILNNTQDEAVKVQCREQLEKFNVHASEYSSVGLQYDHYIDNNGTIDDLHKQIESVINL
jgi:hypothetical protein